MPVEDDDSNSRMSNYGTARQHHRLSFFSRHAPFLVLIVSLTANNLVFAFLSNNIFTKEAASLVGVGFFVLTVGAAIATGHFLLVKLASKSTLRLRKVDRTVDLLFKLSRVCQYSLATLLFVLTLQVLFSSQYYSFILLAILFISFGNATVVTLFLSYKMFSWYKSNRDDGNGSNVGTFIVALTVAILCIGTMLTSFVNANILLQESPASIESGREIRESELRDLSNPGSNLSKMSGATGLDNLTLIRNTFLPFRVSFILVWISSSYLLRGYRKSLGSLKFWIIVTLPLASNLVAFLHSSLLPSFTVEDRILLVLSAVAGGALISFSFIAISRGVSKSTGKSKEDVISYMRLSAYGTILLLVSLSSPVLFFFFPPFGVASWSLVGLSALLFSVGIYSSAISLSEDTQLRASIKRNAIDDSKILHEFGTAQMKQDVEKRVLKVVKEQKEVLESKTGIESSLNEDEAKQYLDEVLREVKGNRGAT